MQATSYQQERYQLHWALMAQEDKGIGFFYYNGYRTNDSKYRRGASTSNIFLSEMKGHLDVDIMKILGCNEDRVKKADVLVFFSITFAIL